MKIFIDAEFTDFLDPRLISIGMVSDAGEEFYAEVPFPEAEASAFVREAIIPQLGKHPDAFCELTDLGARVAEWLEDVRGSNEEVEICFDYQTDWDLFADALNNSVPPWCKPRNVARNINKLLRYAYHKKNGLPEHHALHDAHAARAAFVERRPVST